MASVIYGSRALPVAWLTRRGGKGHFSLEDHRVLLDRVGEIADEQADVPR